MHSFEVIRLKSNSKITHLIEKLFHKKKKKFFIICIQVFWEVVQSLNTYIKLKA